MVSQSRALAVSCGPLGGRRLTALTCLLGLSAGCHLGENINPNQPRQPTIIWQTPIAALGPPALDDSSVYFVLHTHSIVAVSRATGHYRWTGNPDLVTSDVTLQKRPMPANRALHFGVDDPEGFLPVTGNRRRHLGNTTGPLAR